MNNLIKHTLEKAQGVAEKFVLNISSNFTSSICGERFGMGVGSSLEFLDHREYQQGDDIRHIDWNALARSDKLTIKLFKEEISPHIEILLDGSSSMNSDKQVKYRALISMATIMKVAASNAGFDSSIWMLKEQCQKIEDAKYNLLSLSDVSEMPEMLCDYPDDIGKTLLNYLPPLKPRSIRVFISDLFWNTEPTAVLRQLSDNAAFIIIIQVVTKEDENPNLLGNVRLIDSETGETIEVMAASSLCRQYFENFNRHRNYWRDSCTKAGALFSHIVADDFIKDFMAIELLKTGILIARAK